MKSLHISALLVVLALLIAGCDRTFITEVESVTRPELHVFVQDANANRLSGASVSLYRTEQDRDSGTNAIISRETDGEGKIVATESELAQPGVFFVRATRDGLTGQGQTPYMLLNDGVTYFHLTVQ